MSERCGVRDGSTWRSLLRSVVESTERPRWWRLPAIYKLAVSMGRNHTRLPEMHIFIDESGVFVPSRTRSGISLVCALVIPDGRMANVERKYKAIRTQLSKERGEVKGRLLAEADMAKVVDLLRRNECLLEVVGIDLNMHSDADIGTHKLDLARVMVAGATNTHHPNVHGWVRGLAERIQALPNQLYVQSTVMTELVRHTCEHAINYYAQRRPQELAAFHWVVDGKDKLRTTEAESLWTNILLPLLMARSVEQPMALFEEGDYEHFKRFEGALPDWLPKPEGAAETTTDIKRLMMEHFRYSSDSEPGLELVDILASAARRALVGRLQMSGWSGLPSLMIHRREHYIHLVKLHGRPTEPNIQYARVLRRFTQGGRVMLAPRFLRE
jgi:hypothetical protein